VHRAAAILAALLLGLCVAASAAAQDATGPVPPPGAPPELAAAEAGEEPAAEPAAAPEGEPAAEAEPEPEPDTTSDFYLSRCAGCHTVGGGDLTGPDLAPSTEWPAADLAKAVERMEKNVGPMSDERVASLVELMKDPRLAERLSAARERQVEEMAATLEPASPRRGADLFHGGEAFARGGLPCAACHRAGDAGGTLAADLTDAALRLGEPALVSAAENPGFPLMRAAYRDHPVTRQEAVHLAAYLAALEPPAEGAAAAAVPPAGPPIGAWGGGIAAVLLAAMLLVYRGRNRGVRGPLVAAARRR
jgi:mono/diheme cytochrome c family protein